MGLLGPGFGRSPGGIMKEEKGGEGKGGEA